MSGGAEVMTTLARSGSWLFNLRVLTGRCGRCGLFPPMKRPKFVNGKLNTKVKAKLCGLCAMKALRAFVKGA